MSEDLSEDELNERSNEKRRKHKTAKDKLLATKTKVGGLLVVHTGKGKGKTTAAMGIVARCIGHGKRVGIVQFVKGSWETGERVVLEAFPELVTITAMGEGFTWETQDRARDIQAANAAWVRAKQMIEDPDLFLVLLDEINIVLRNDYIDINQVVEYLAKKPANKHVICTGRNAKQVLIDMADLVTEMTEIRHHFRNGYKAQAGIEF
jgi:cob(I)alamin adenosyltransferase